jgi:hypothetical protein
MITLPTVNIGGTNKTMLVDSYNNARLALEEARVKLIETVPHPRDYREDGYAIALAEHIKRLQKLQIIIDELQVLSLGVYDQ